MTWGTPATVDLLKEQCNRYANGQCQTRRCLVRGGYAGAGSVDYGAATCQNHEAVCAIEALADAIDLLGQPAYREVAGSEDERSDYMHTVDRGLRALALTASSKELPDH